jgi:hypothetical protein
MQMLEELENWDYPTPGTPNPQRERVRVAQEPEA